MADEAQVADDQVASQDEYQISLLEGVDDETLLENSTEAKRFAITSYGADYTVDSLVKRMRDGAFTIPEFQRRFVWSQRHASKFIESLLMGLPVPGIFLYKEAVTNKHLVIDGQQRLRTLEAFYDGTFGERKFRLTGVIDDWAGKAYQDLDPTDQLKLDDSIVHATIFSQDEPKDVLDSIYFVFERINTGGIRLTGQEIRNAIAAGPFTKLIQELNHDKSWREIFGGPENKHAKDEELIIRVMAMLDKRKVYSRPMSKFLTDYAAEMNKKDPKILSDHAELFRRAVSLVNKALNGKAFRPTRSLNAAVLDAVMVGLSTRLRQGGAPDPQAFADAYEKLLADDKFRDGWIRATADEENVKKRMEIAISAFASI